MASRLKEKYFKEIADILKAKFNYKNIMQIPKIEKVVINVGIGEAVGTPKTIDVSYARYNDYFRTKACYY